MQPHGQRRPAIIRSFVIGLVAFLTVIDLFAAQAILPSLAHAYGVAPGQTACLMDGDLVVGRATIA